MKTLSEIRGRKQDHSDLYFDTYTAAINLAIKTAEKEGFKTDDEERMQEIGMGPGKPSRGKTTRHTLLLYKNGKQQRKALHIQVYNRGTPRNTYELNWYIA